MLLLIMPHDGFLNAAETTMGGGDSKPKQEAAFETGPPSGKVPKMPFNLNSVSINPRIACGTDSGVISIWDAGTGKKELEYLISDLKPMICALVPLPGDRLACASWDGLLRCVPVTASAAAPAHCS